MAKFMEYSVIYHDKDDGSRKEISVSSLAAARMVARRKASDGHRDVRAISVKIGPMTIKQYTF